MKIVVDENKKIVAYATVGDLENAIEVESFNFDNSKIDKYYYLNGDILLLEDGQYIKDNQIVTVEKPHEEIEYIWDDTNNLWKLKYTKEELMTERKNKILKYAELKKEIETLTEFADEFESDNTVAMLQEEMQKIKQEINELLTVIKKLK